MLDAPTSGRHGPYHPSNEATKPFNRGTTWINVICFALGLTAAALLNFSINRDSISPIKRQTNYLESLCANPEARNRNLILFIGSSFTRTDIDPAELKSIFRREGRGDVEIFCVAVPTYDIHGTRTLLKRVLKIPNIENRLKLVVLDQSSLSRRYILAKFSGDAPHLWMMGDPLEFETSIKTILESGAPVPQQVAFIREAATNFLMANFKAGWIGSGLRVASRTSLHREKEGSPYSIRLPLSDSMGFTPLEGQSEGGRRLSWWKPEMKQRLEAASRRNRLIPNDLSIMRSTFDLILGSDRFDHVKVMSVVYPSFCTDNRSYNIRDAIPEAGSRRVVVEDFSDPASCPQLYAHGLFYEHQHLNAEGARIFTRRLGPDLLSLYESN